MGKFLYEDIVNDFQDKIESKSLAQGAKLPSERILAETYGVSRNVIREALKVLSEKGLIEIRPGKGGYVSILEDKQIQDKLELAVFKSRSNLLDILEVREILEKGIVKKAVQKADAKNISRLKEIYNKMERHLVSQTNFAAEDALFHKELANCTNNNMLIILMTSFYQMIDKKLFQVTQRYTERTIQGQQEHRQIIDAIESRDGDKAVAAIENHMACIREQLEDCKE